ncbi:recombinase family protein [Hankyongella ginsenosidimutans]|uniref:recombinase family protein n=1 Tax=Hankyongella ginsenosidimutans TaxID=1763828 RepID=UPI001FEA60D2|nr:recombinase family protein [Hankyongella ginsenosidimutans]
MTRKTDRSTLRCAIYTRKSTEEGLEQAFNSLDAQREACAAYITSQRHEGWRMVPDLYDDGGYSGGNMDRPGLVQLLEDVRAGKVDVIVVYKVDRLTRSLADFAKIVEVLDKQGASFVSVTQAFNTTTSMGPHPQCPALLRPVRARGDGRAHPRQDRRLQGPGHVDGRGRAAGLQGRGSQAGRRA